MPGSLSRLLLRPSRLPHSLARILATLLCCHIRRAHPAAQLAAPASHLHEEALALSYDRPRRRRWKGDGGRAKRDDGRSRLLVAVTSPWRWSRMVPPSVPRAPFNKSPARRTLRVGTGSGLFDNGVVGQKEVPVTQLRKQMLEELRGRNYSQTTVKGTRGSRDRGAGCRRDGPACSARPVRPESALHAVGAVRRHRMAAPEAHGFLPHGAGRWTHTRFP